MDSQGIQTKQEHDRTRSNDIKTPIDVSAQAGQANDKRNASQKVLFIICCDLFKLKKIWQYNLIKLTLMGVCVQQIPGQTERVHGVRRR